MVPTSMDINHTSLMKIDSEFDKPILGRFTRKDTPHPPSPTTGLNVLIREWGLICYITNGV